MTVLSVLSEEEVGAIATEVFTRHATLNARPDLVIEAKPSFEGDDALYVTAVYPDDVHRPNASMRAELRQEIGQKLLEKGDFRFVFLSTLSRSDQNELLSPEAEGLPHA